MLQNWKDRIEGLKRIVLALGVMCLCIMTSLQYQKTQVPLDPSIVKTSNAAYENCSVSLRES